MRHEVERRCTQRACDVRHSGARGARGTVPPMRRLIVLGLLLLAMGPPVEYGGIWSLRAHPVPDVTVRLPNGQSVTGELSRAWSKDWTLRTAGGVLQFPEAGGYQWMTFPVARGKAPSGASTAVITLLAHWRSFLPLALVCIVALGCALDGAIGPTLASDDDPRKDRA